MTNRELIEQLQNFPPNEDVRILGEVRPDAGKVLGDIFKISLGGPPVVLGDLQAPRGIMIRVAFQ